MSRRHGKVLEEGASGFLEKKLAISASCGAASDNTDVGWSHFSKICSNKSSSDAISFGSKEWSSVYLASTPQQAAELGIKFPGVDEVSTELFLINIGQRQSLAAGSLFYGIKWLLFGLCLLLKNI